MTGNEIALPDMYRASITEVRGGRRDVHVEQSGAVRSFEQTDIVRHLREFFAAIDAEAQEVAGDPVALVNALARLETLTADLRAVRDSVKRLAAVALADQRIRRLMVEGVASVESTSEIKRSGWQHARLLGDMLERHEISLLDRKTGERLDSIDAAMIVLEWMRPEWKMTPVRDSGLNPDDYCHIATDDEDRPMRTPTIRMADNLIRRMTNDKETTT